MVMEYKFYKLVENIPKYNHTHVKLHYVDLFTEVIESFIKLKVGTALEDDHENIFRVSGYYGEYIILRPDKLNSYPVGEVLIWKKK